MAVLSVRRAVETYSYSRVSTISAPNLWPRAPARRPTRGRLQVPWIRNHPPPLPHQILGERIGLHGAARHDVEHIGPAVVEAQPVVRGAGIEQESVAGRQVGQRQHLIGMEVQDEETPPPASASLNAATRSPSSGTTTSVSV